MPKTIKHEDDCRQAILRGMDAVADLVGSTLGPRGHTVILSRPQGTALVTKDGVTVAKGVALPDAWENEGAKLIQEVAAKTNTEAGDGTTAATILTRALYKEGIRQIAAGADSQALERGMHKAAARVVEELKKLATAVAPEDLVTLTAVATIAANGDHEMGSVIARAVSHAGIEGNYTLDPAPTAETVFEVAEGLQFKRGLDKWPQFINDQRGMAILAPANIFVTDRRMIAGDEMAAFLQAYVRLQGQVPLLIVADDIAEGALQVLTVNHNKTLRACPVRAPFSGLEKKEFLEDIATLTGARSFTIARGDKLQNLKADDLGSADRVLVTPYRTTIIGGHGAAIAIDARKEALRGRIADPETQAFERAGLEQRLAAISAKIAVIKLGSNVNSKLLEKRDRAEDSLNATLGALKEGVVPGGGVALVRTGSGLLTLIGDLDGDERLGAKIVAHALSCPLRTIAQNAGAAPDVVAERVTLFGSVDLGGHQGAQDPDGAEFPRGYGPNFNRYGYNAATGTFEDLVSAGIIDPVKVVRLALENSVELAGLLLTSSGGVVEVPEPTAAAQARLALGGRP